jgi:hypothetical protein
MGFSKEYPLKEFDMGRRKCRIILTLVVAGSIALTGCKKEAEQIVSKPLGEVKGTAVAVRHTPTPTPSASPSASPIPTDEEYVKGEFDENMPVWQQVGNVLVLTAMAVIVIYWILRWCRKPAPVVEDAGVPSVSGAAKVAGADAGAKKE